MAPKITLGCRRLRLGEISRALSTAAASTAYESSAIAASRGTVSMLVTVSHSAWGREAETKPIAISSSAAPA